MMGFD